MGSPKSHPVWSEEHTQVQMALLFECLVDLFSLGVLRPPSHVLGNTAGQR